MHRAQDRANYTRSRVHPMHRAQDSRVPPRSLASILCTGHRIHEFCFAHSIPSYAQGTGFTSSASVILFHPMHRAQHSRVPPNSSGGSQKSKKSEGRQELHSNLMILMECVLDLALGAPLPIWSSHRRNPLDFALSWTSRSKAARNCAFLRGALLREVQDKARSPDLGDLTTSYV